LGVRRSPESTLNKLWNLGIYYTCSTTGQQLTLDDITASKIPLLAEMTEIDSKYMKGLKLFSNRTVYANIINDNTVPYPTASINPFNPYKNKPLPDIKVETNSKTEESFPHIIKEYIHDPSTISAQEQMKNSAEYYKNDNEKGELLRNMYNNLNSLLWKKSRCLYRRSAYTWYNCS